jgi:lauroyl/myristoyl acyltransferase
MSYHAPVQFTPSGDHDRDVLALTTQINDVLEQMIRAEPSQWLWVHRRWPTPKDVASPRVAQALGGAGVRVEREGSSLI